MALTGPADGPPRFIPGALASAARGAGMALHALAPDSALARLDAPALLGERAALLGLARQGERAPGGRARLIATRNGHLVLNLARDEDWQLVPAWLEVAPDPDVSRQDESAIDRVIARRESSALVARGRLMGLAVAPAATSVPSDAPLFRLHHASERSPRPRLPTAPDVPRERPIRLLDLSSLWAGPLATSLLAIAGVDVLKIENPTRPDGARAGSRAFFDLMNGNKRGCPLDLHEARDRTIFERLLESADVVVESARPRALAQLGYDAEGWVQAKPGRLWTSITGYGRTHEWIAFGDDAAVAAGLAWSPDPNITGPVFPADAIADPLAGLHAAALILAHLERGRGGLLDISLRDVAAHAGSIAIDPAFLPVALPPCDLPDSAADANGSVVEAGREIAIATPRARSPHGSAPPLVAPDAATLSAWTSRC
jgi:hypothetical protein